MRQSRVSESACILRSTPYLFSFLAHAPFKFQPDPGPVSCVIEQGFSPVVLLLRITRRNATLAQRGVLCCLSAPSIDLSDIGAIAQRGANRTVHDGPYSPEDYMSVA